MRNFYKNHRGSFTIEASLIFPVIFLITVAMLFFSIFIYQKVTLYSLASETAEKAAFVWDNSYRDINTGEYENGQKDPLYWRTLNDNMTDLVAVMLEEERASVEIDQNGNVVLSDNNSLSNLKLKNAAGLIPRGISGKISYQNLLVERTIEVELETVFKNPILGIFFKKEIISAKATAKVTEPTQFIRNVDFIFIYAQELKHRLGSRSTKMKNK
jgi:uncharacterized protein (UPF0333 family)